MVKHTQTIRVKGNLFRIRIGYYLKFFAMHREKDVSIEKLGNLSKNGGLAQKKVRGSRSQMFFKIAVLKNFAISTGKHLGRVSFLIELKNFIENRLQHKCFSVNIVKFLGTALFYRTPLVVAPEKW